MARSRALPRLRWPVTASQVSMAGNSSRGGREERSATVSRRKTKVKCHVYVMLPYSSCSSLFSCALYFISPFVCLFLFSLSFFFGAFCVCVSVFICLEIFHLHWHFAPCSDKLQQQDELTQSPLEVPPPPPTSSLGLAPTRRFMTFTFMTGICVCLCVCAPFPVCKREKQLKY